MAGSRWSLLEIPGQYYPTLTQVSIAETEGQVLSSPGQRVLLSVVEQEISHLFGSQS